MLGLSASLLAGGTAGLPQLLPGPGQLHPVKPSRNLCGNTGEYFPFTGGGCNASIGCNARSLSLDLMFELQNGKYFLISQKIRPIMVT